MESPQPQAVCPFGASFMHKQILSLTGEIEGTLAARDSATVHRMRVASRRLRNALDLFKGCFPPNVRKAWGDAVRRITHVLGDARDTDVQIALLRVLLEEPLPDDVKPGYLRLLLRLNQRREKYQNKIITGLGALQDEGFFSGMQSMLKDLSEESVDAQGARQALRRKASEDIQTRLDDFLTYRQVIPAEDNGDKLHAMRIAGKRLRYTLEVYAPLYGPSLASYIAHMRTVQDQLGEIHDNDVWIRWLPKFVHKERERIAAYFGNIGPLQRLLPGFEHLAEDRQEARDHAYQTFVRFWEQLESENTWASLREVVAVITD